jgi:hypothetical protein
MVISTVKFSFGSRAASIRHSYLRSVLERFWYELYLLSNSRGFFTYGKYLSADMPLGMVINQY